MMYWWCQHNQQPEHHISYNIPLTLRILTCVCSSSTCRYSLSMILSLFKISCTSILFLCWWVMFNTWCRSGCGCVGLPEVASGEEDGVWCRFFGFLGEGEDGGVDVWALGLLCSFPVALNDGLLFLVRGVTTSIPSLSGVWGKSAGPPVLILTSNSWVAKKKY